jgi:ribosomal protein S18 acetylase RimI-like enzyme
VRIYIEEEIIGKGYGSALMDFCLEEAKKNGYRTIWLGVWEKNLRAIRFYRMWRFTKVGTKEFVLGSDLQNDHIMARPVEMIA